MRKFLRAIGIVFISLPLPIVLGTAGSSDLGTISFKQAVLQCSIAIAIGVVGFVLMHIAEHTPKTEPTPVPNVNPYAKCCNCPHYVDCCKGYTELLQCKGGETI